MSATSSPALTPAEARAIAQDAYIYGFPLLDSYRILYAYYVDTAGPEFKAPWNVVSNSAQVYTPADRAVQAPNSDTPYSNLGFDLRSEPLVFTVPPIEAGRYYSLQFIDLYTYNFAYVGSRTTGNGGGTYLLAGPDWQGETPPGIDAVIPCETELGLVVYRTQLFDPADIDHVVAIQAGYQVQPLSVFLGTPPPDPAPAIDFPVPLTADEERTSLTSFNELAFLLQFCPIDPSEVALRQRFAQLGIVPGQPFDPDALCPEIRQAVQDGIADAWQAYDALQERINAGEITSGDLAGTREFMHNNYLYRMALAINGIYGNSKDEALYPLYLADDAGQPLAGANRYALRLAPGQLPPVNAFWSVTLYDLPDRLLVENAINRYLINSPMLPDLVTDADGGVTLDVQHAAPHAARTANWLPAPEGAFMLAMRLYWPKAEALDGTWTAPPLQRVT